MGQYEVTQELYKAVMGNNPSSFNENPSAGEIQIYRPVDSVNWYQAIAFCNELTKNTLGKLTVFIIQIPYIQRNIL